MKRNGKKVSEEEKAVVNCWKLMSKQCRYLEYCGDRCFDKPERPKCSYFSCPIINEA